MTFLCRNCGSSDFRRSRFRLSDLGSVFTLQYPVRCHVCKLRRHVPFFLALRYRRTRPMAGNTSAHQG